MERLADVGGWEWAPETGEIIWSDNLFRLYGLSPRRVRPTLDLVFERTHTDDRARLDRALTRAVSTGQLVPLDLRIVRTDGVVRHLRALGTAERRDHDGTRRLIGAVQDVTGQLRAEREVAVRIVASQVVRSWDVLETSAERLVREVGEALDLPFGVLWLPRDGALAPAACWSATGDRRSRSPSV